MKNRIHELRKDLHLSQEQFADNLGLSRNFISLVEKGDRNISDRTISDICRLYKVNEDWLRTGEGQMYVELTRESEIAEITLALAKSDDDMTLELSKLLLKMSPDQIRALYNFMITVIEKDHP